MDLYDSDKSLREQAERLRISVGETYKRAAEADLMEDVEGAARLREQAIRQTRRADLLERLIGYENLKQSRMKLLSFDVEDAHKLLNRFDRNPIETVLSRTDLDEHAKGRTDIILNKACDWTFGNAVRTEALAEIVRMTLLMERQGVEVNIAALARLTGISRQTLHARLREARKI
ncbi:hypothetical protein [Streptosporangium sp. NPDC020145]|uniref:hypothetical protein n=1 Tax=Streptosporangium sp. NPDC020145 TaxID=3154694 RepID=UPI00342B11A7